MENFMGNTFGRFFRITTFGESHGPALGVVIDGLPAGITFPHDTIQHELNRRKPGQSDVTTSRVEADTFEILSGVFEGKSTGAPLCIIVRNTNQKSEDYDAFKNLFRPGHADFTYHHKYGFRDYRGGGRASARETVARVIAGALAKSELKKQRVSICAYTSQIHTIHSSFDFSTLSGEELEKTIENNLVRCPDPIAAQKMEHLILETQKAGDSLGGIVTVIVKNPPVGLGDPVFDKLDAELAKALMSLPAVKGVEIGDGFNVATLKGSECNDQLTPQGFTTNHQGGILGGISTGQDIVMRVAFKPPSSIAREQETIDIYSNTVTFKMTGRHDPCVVPRAVPIVEAMVAIVLYDAWLAHKISRYRD